MKKRRFAVGEKESVYLIGANRVNDDDRTWKIVLQSITLCRFRQWIIWRMPLNRIFHVMRSFVGSNRKTRTRSTIPRAENFHDCITAWRMLTMYERRIWSSSGISNVRTMVILIYWWLSTYSANMPG